MLAARLKAQRVTGSRYYVGNALTAVDVYSATSTAMFRPLPHEQCKMNAATRAAFETLDARTEAALDPILLEHRDMMYGKHLELPLRFEAFAIVKAARAWLQGPCRALIRGHRLAEPSEHRCHHPARAPVGRWD